MRSRRSIGNWFQPKVPAFDRQVDQILAASRAARDGGLQGQYNTYKKNLESVSRQLDKLVLADKKDFHAWTLSRYVNVYHDERPDLDNPRLEAIDVQMAMDEFRDSVFMVSSCGKDVRLAVEVKPSVTLPAGAVQVRQTVYFNFKSGQEELGDALAELEGPLEVPKDQSRQVWLTFNTRTSGRGMPTRHRFASAVGTTDSTKQLLDAKAIAALERL